MMLGIGVSVSVLTLSMMRQQRTLEEKDAQLQASLPAPASGRRPCSTPSWTPSTWASWRWTPDGHDILMNRKQRANHVLARPKDIADPNESQLLVFGAGPHHPRPR